MRCPGCNHEITGSMTYCNHCGMPLENMQNAQSVSSFPENKPPRNKKKKLIPILVAVVAILLVIIVVLSIFVIGKLRGRSLSEEELNKAKDAYTPPAEHYQIDPDAEDASNDDIHFTYDDRARIISCKYEIDGRMYQQDYIYHDEKQQVVITTTYESETITEATIDYSKLKYYDKIEEIDGYYIRLDEESTDLLTHEKKGFDLDQHVVEYNGAVYYVDQQGLWINDSGKSELLYKGIAKNLATDGKTVYFGVFNEEKSKYSQSASMTLSWQQFDMYAYDTGAKSCKKVMSFNECGKPICQVDGKIYYTDYPDDYDGFAVERSHDLYSYDTKSGKKSLLVKEKAHLIDLYKHKIYYRRLVAAMGTGVADLECYDIDTGKTETTVKGEVTGFEVIGDSLYYTILNYKNNEYTYLYYRCDIPNDKTENLFDETAPSMGMGYFDSDYLYYIKGSSFDSAAKYRYDIKAKKSEELSLPEDAYVGACKRNDGLTVFLGTGKLRVLEDGATKTSGDVSCSSGQLVGFYHHNAYVKTGQDFYFYDIEVVPIETKKEAAAETKNTEPPAEKTEPTEDTVADELFSQVPERFFFSSGAGNWGTTLNVHEDGTFDGNYSDTDMGIRGDGYPNGTRHVCNFTGKFTEVEKINDYTYSMKVSDLEYDHEVGDEEIVDGVKLIYSEANGLAKAKTVYIYTPDTPRDELSEELKSWLHLNIEPDSDLLGIYALYNTDEKLGFRGEKNNQ